MPGRPTIWIVVGQGPIALAVGAGGGCLDIFTLRYLFSSFSLSLGVVRCWWINFQCRGVLQFGRVVGWCDGAGKTSSAGASCLFGLE